jgi:hypothetical protein
MIRSQSASPANSGNNAGMCCSSLSRSAAGNVRIASSISRAVLINAYDRAGDRAGKGDQHAGPPRTIPVSAIFPRFILLNSSFILSSRFSSEKVSASFSPDKLPTEIIISP